jgi:predicted aminopeptidase
MTRRTRRAPVATRASHATPGIRASLVALAICLLGLSACSDVTYYWQAMSGQWEVLHKRRPIATVLADPAVPEAIKSRLRLAIHVQDFAVAALDLPASGRYTTYTDLGRPYVSWLVVAAPALQMQERTWCYLFVGCLGYRGFFDRADAVALAKELHAEGFDVLIRPVRAYSTLGWFNDPLLNTFLQQDELDVMSTLIHEHTHQRVWVNGDTGFNESFAVFVEQEGLRRFLQQATADDLSGVPPAEMLVRYAAYRADRARFDALAMDGRRRLAELYAQPLSDAEKLARKAQVLDAIRQDYQKQRSSFTLLNYDSWFGPELNNAFLAGIAQYHVRLDAFAALFEQQGRDFGRFYAATETLGKLNPPERETALDRLAAEYAPAAQGVADKPAAGAASSLPQPSASSTPGAAHVAR